MHQWVIYYYKRMATSQDRNQQKTSHASWLIICLRCNWRNTYPTILPLIQTKPAIPLHPPATPPGILELPPHTCIVPDNHNSVVEGIRLQAAEIHAWWIELHVFGFYCSRHWFGEQLLSQVSACPIQLPIRNYLELPHASFAGVHSASCAWGVRIPEIGGYAIILHHAIAPLQQPSITTILDRSPAVKHLLNRQLDIHATE